MLAGIEPAVQNGTSVPATPLDGTLALLVAVAGGFAVLGGSFFYLYLHRSRMRHVIGACTALTTVAILMPLVFPEWTVIAGQRVGALASAAVVFICFGCFLFLLSMFSRKYGAVLALIVVASAIPLLVMHVKGELDSQLSVFANRNNDVAAAKPTDDTLRTSFDDWLKVRSVSSSKPYPVFVIAAQGGGIYAAAAVSEFLASLEDQCPGFAKHVFAISAVSGGAVGATAFNSVHSRDNDRLRDGCQSADRGDATRRTQAVLLQDHLGLFCYCHPRPRSQVSLHTGLPLFIRFVT
ncbi:MAG: hypothetical protein HC869_10790 [Rhodospirillales bacterium]|nr:hypothetical protein [Rhodospirillales bacterium]